MFSFPTVVALQWCLIEPSLIYNDVPVLVCLRFILTMMNDVPPPSPC